MTRRPLAQHLRPPKKRDPVYNSTANVVVSFASPHRFAVRDMAALDVNRWEWGLTDG